MSRGPEAELQKQVKYVYTLVGCELYDLSQGYRPDPGGTRQTPGLPDLYGFLPFPAGAFGMPAGEPAQFWHEVKTPDGIKEHFRLIAIPVAEVKKSQVKAWKRAVAQSEFRRLCLLRGIPYAIGGVEEAKTLLLQVGLAYKDNRGTIFLGKRRVA